MAPPQAALWSDQKVYPMGVFTILAVEDNADHAALIEMVLRSGLPGCDVRIASSGTAAMDYLGSMPKSADFLRPGLIILDMWLGDTTGLDLLEWLSVRPQFADIPVIMFTSSADPDVARRAYDLGVRRFVLKGPDFRELVEVVKEVLPLWTHGSRTPDADEKGA